jgi:toxin-antitoxin system PIN domain toxin
VIAVDTNILVAFLRSEYPDHGRIRSHVAALAEGPLPWASPWPCIHEVLAVVTNPRIFKVPLDPPHALDAIAALLESPTVRAIAEGPAYWPIFQRLVTAAAVTGPRIHDARIAAICLSSGVSELWTADRDFSRFPSLRTRNPAVA